MERKSYIDHINIEAEITTLALAQEFVTLRQVQYAIRDKHKILLSVDTVRAHLEKMTKERLLKRWGYQGCYRYYARRDRLFG